MWSLGSGFKILSLCRISQYLNFFLDCVIFHYMRIVQSFQGAELFRDVVQVFVEYVGGVPG